MIVKHFIIRFLILENIITGAASQDKAAHVKSCHSAFSACTSVTKAKNKKRVENLTYNKIKVLLHNQASIYGLVKSI